MIVRPARETDVEAIGELWTQLAVYHRELSDLMPRPRPDGGRYYARRISSQLHDPQARVFVAEMDSKIIGYVIGFIIDLVPDTFEDERSGFIADIFVVADYRRQSAGRKLVDAMKAWFIGRDIKYFEWYVASDNPDSIAFWRSVGGRDVLIRMRSELS